MCYRNSKHFEQFTVFHKTYKLSNISFIFNYKVNISFLLTLFSYSTSNYCRGLYKCKS